MANPDDTVLLRPPHAPRPGRWLRTALVVAGLCAAGGLCGFWTARWLGAGGPSDRQDAIPRASEASITGENPAGLTVLRFSANPAVVVLDFPTLAEQGRMFNRLAAWAEKAGVGHDRVPSEATLAAAIAASGATADTYYYGHDYSSGAVQRFFALAHEENVALRPEEEELRRIAARATAEPAGFGAVITLVRADAANGVSASARATILHHELSHGEYFTNPAYADYVAMFWQNVLTAPERAAFRSYLAREGYDPALEDLMRNEMQAYLMHTPDPTFFAPERLGIPPARLAELRATFLAGMPAGWLRDAVAARAAARPPQPRRGQRDGRVSSGRTAAATLPPRRRRASTAARKPAR